MKEIGRLRRLMGRGSSSLIMEIFMMVSEKLTRRKVMEFIFSILVQSMRDSGRGTKNMAKAHSSSEMVIFTRVIGATTSKMAKVA